MKIYTKTGDDGTTSLAGGNRVPKHSLRIEAYGTVDELISWIGLIAAQPENLKRNSRLLEIQDRLMHCASLLSVGPGARVEKMVPPNLADIELLERDIDDMEADLEPLTSFVLPGGSVVVSNIHIARCVCRRAERSILRVGQTEEIDALIIKYINRLSDFLFVLARRVEYETGFDQPRWIP